MDLPIKPQLIESDYEVKLGVFEGPLDLLLYLVQKNELNPREIAISTITDQYLQYIDGIEKMNLSNAGEFLVMAARLMRLKARELLPADQKDELEEMEYELDRQALIQQMLEYQKFKEAARVLRNFEGRNFGAFARGREESEEDRKDEELEEEAGIFDLLTAFRSVVMQRPKRIPVHEVEIDDVTIEDRMQEVEIALNERGRSQFEDLFPHDNRTIVKVVTLMAMLELCKLDRVVFRQSRALGPIWVYRKARSSEYELELRNDEGHQEPLPEFKAGLPELVREQAKQRTAQTALEAALRELEQELLNPGQTPAASEALGVLGPNGLAVGKAAAPEAAPEAVPEAATVDTASEAAVGVPAGEAQGSSTAPAPAASPSVDAAPESAPAASSPADTASGSAPLEEALASVTPAAGSSGADTTEGPTAGSLVEDDGKGSAGAAVSTGQGAVDASTGAAPAVTLDAAPVSEVPGPKVGAAPSNFEGQPVRGAWRRKPKAAASNPPAEPAPEPALEPTGDKATGPSAELPGGATGSTAEPAAGAAMGPASGGTAEPTAGPAADQTTTPTAGPTDEPPTEAENAALRDLMQRIREAPEPDLSVPGTDDEDD